MRFRTLVAFVLTFALPAIAPAGPIYLALGDSSAFGETDRTKNPSNGDRGYVAPFADYLGLSRYPTRPAVVNLALDGETSKSYAPVWLIASRPTESFTTPITPSPRRTTRRSNSVSGRSWLRRRPTATASAP